MYCWNAWRFDGMVLFTQKECDKIISISSCSILEMNWWKKRLQILQNEIEIIWKRWFFHDIMVPNNFYIRYESR